MAVARNLPREDGAFGFTSATAEDIDVFRSIVGEEGLVTDAEDLVPYNTDWMKKWSGSSRVVVLPKTTVQVSRVLAHCHARAIAVVPQGGNTGLVGGSIPTRDEVILSTSRLNEIVAFDAAGGVLTCGAGCVLEALDAYLTPRGHCVPLDLGAKGTCQIGGNVSTNAGGVRVMRYGALRASVLGLEVVLADGTVLDLLRTNRKDNTGYDLKQLFIGAEGTLGVVTKVAIATPPRPTAVSVAILKCPNFDVVLQLFALAKTALGEILSAVELMDSLAVETAMARCPGLKRPMELEDGAFAVLLETSGSCEEHDKAKMGALLDRAFAAEIVDDGVIAQDMSQAADLWAIREHVPVAAATGGYQYKYDVSVPIPRFYELVRAVRRRFQELSLAEDRAAAFGYGHLGDGNLHLNVVCARKDDEVLRALEPFVFDWVVAAGGSISAEHGVGQHKRAFLGLQKGPEALALMAAIKRAFDPRGILNPGKVLPDDPVSQ
ncbi:FAD-binding domain-containing protein [Tribonema minus]|uniref:FAD-binding domain-containing protein n=1 Tax=Tribonema minus TaxID=303371 RepID=A0A835ZEX4_9STRA|nr:FAD-binding domain-containing protein [Tribonema minus]